jgi:exonuclease VII small subunit
MLAGLANNMNQIAKKYNQGERMPIELMRVLEQVGQVIKKIMHDDRSDKNR